MSSYIEQIRRMKEAREKDESPLVAALNKNKLVRAHLNTEGGAKENREFGDVWFSVLRFDEDSTQNATVFGPIYIESQVSRKHTKFSYSFDKLEKYKGEWVYLACMERPEFQGGPVSDMVHCVIRRDELHALLIRVAGSNIVGETNPVKGIYLMEKNGRKFFTIYPTALTNCESALFSETLEGAVEELIEHILEHAVKES